jgi:hypothetical protein
LIIFYKCVNSAFHFFYSVSIAAFMLLFFSRI